MQYYWISYHFIKQHVEENVSKPIGNYINLDSSWTEIGYNNMIISIHPLEWQKEQDEQSIKTNKQRMFTLLNWMDISHEEALMFLPNFESID